jgi:hypothetical protein
MKYGPILICAAKNMVSMCVGDPKAFFSRTPDRHGRELELLVALRA